MWRAVLGNFAEAKEVFFGQDARDLWDFLIRNTMFSGE